MDRKVALVIGGSGGIGSEIVRLFVKKGIQVCSTYNRKREKAEDLFRELDPQSVSLYQMNLADDVSVEHACQQILIDHQKVDHVVFTATALVNHKNILNMAWRDFEEHITIQTKGLFGILQNLKAQIKAKHKTKFIVVLTEYCFGRPPSGLSHYVTAKYSLMGLCKAMTAELSKFNCTVNMISPGMVETDLISSLPAKLIEITAENNPLKRIALPGDVANLAYFLASDEADYLNGVNILVNGGGIVA